jgi:hypothetical protein
MKIYERFFAGSTPTKFLSTNRRHGMPHTKGISSGSFET